MSMLRLFKHNPWWTDAALTQDAPEILAWAKSGFRRGPLEEISFEPDDAVYSLRGPRQVGKTTLLKLEIKRLLEAGVPAKNVFYYSFDLESGPRDVADIMDEYLEWSEPAGEERRFLFLDEISNVFHWQRAIKSLKDTGRLRRCTVVTTGSHSVDLRRAAELLPGRRGTPSDNLDKIMLPMSFAQYVSAVDEDLGSAVRKGLLATHRGRLSAVRDLARGRIAEEVKRAYTMQAKLDRCLDGYMLSGGLPLAVLDFAARKTIAPKTYKTYMDAAESVVKVAGKSKSKTYQIAASIGASSGSPVSWSSLIGGTDIGSHHTAEEYVGMLDDMFVVSFLYRYDSAANRPKFGANKKIYFRDPLFAHALRSKTEPADAFEQSLRTLDDPGARGRLAEQIVADHVIRMAPGLSSQRAGFDPHYSVMYWTSAKSGREVDFVVRDGGSLIPVEVKCQTKVHRDDMWGLTDFAKATGKGGGIVVTRDELRAAGPVSLVPASVFLLLA